MSAPDLAAASRVLEEAGLVGPGREGPELFLVLGSGLGGLGERLEGARSISLASLPGFPPSGVAGHAGMLACGSLCGRRVLVQSGRYHFYEGHSEAVVAAPMRLAIALGIQGVLLTNAAGGIDNGLSPGRAMILDDHMNLQWRNPLAGPVVDGEARFPDMSEPYDGELRALAETVASEQGLAVSQGTYAAVLGPCYETLAEIEMLRRLGVDAVGMSTVPEALVARAHGIPTLGISLITNFATGMSTTPLDHQEVVEVGGTVARSLAAWISEIVARWPQASDDTGAK